MSQKPSHSETWLKADLARAFRKIEASIDVPQSLLTDFRLLTLCDAYQETNNPLLAWEAFHIARTHKLPVPDWVLAYLDRVSAHFERAQTRDVPRGKGGIASTAVEALELNRHGAKVAANPFAREVADHEGEVAKEMFK